MEDDCEDEEEGPPKLGLVGIVAIVTATVMICFNVWVVVWWIRCRKNQQPTGLTKYVDESPVVEASQVQAVQQG